MSDLERAKAILPEMIANRRFLHQNPELGMNLKVTTEFVMEKLRDMGIEPKICGGCGVTALIGQKTDGPVFLLRADMDALPMQEESGLPFAAADGAAHCCGHDMHTAMLLGAAKILKEQEEELPGIVKLMFQPGEETLEGAKAMIADGILENPRVDAAMGVHMMPLAPAGFVGYNAGVVCNSSDLLHIAIEGKGGHGASPHLSVDPINVGVHIHLALQELIAREVDPQDQAALTFGEFHSGDAKNIIPKTAYLGGTLRTVRQETREYLLARIENCVEMTAKMFGAKASLEIPASVSALTVDETCADIIGKGFSETLGKAAARVSQTTSGSEDFAEVSRLVPSMFFVVGGGDREHGYEFSGHHPKVRYDETSLASGAAAFACGAKAYLAANVKS